MDPGTKAHPLVWIALLACTLLALYGAFTPCLDFAASTANTRGVASLRLRALLVGFVAAVTAVFILWRKSAPGDSLSANRRVGIGCFVALLIIIICATFGYASLLADR